MKLKKKYKILITILFIMSITIFLGTKKDVSAKDKSKTLEYVLLNNIYDEKYKNEYSSIKYTGSSNFSTILTTFLPKGYSGKEINYILTLSKQNQKLLQNKPYTDISKYYKYHNFNVSNIDRYNNYSHQNPELSIKDVILSVNMSLDEEVYTNYKEVTNPNDPLVLVNKYNKLPSNYMPEDITYLDGYYGNKVPVRSILKEEFLKMQEAMQKEISVTLMPTTAFRGENFQTTLYNNYVAKDGIEAADKYSARPGFSEHQTGLAIDTKNASLNGTIRLTDSDYKWLEDNSYKYGFIVRFPQNKENITGYQFENWHFRYVGKKHAKIIHDENLTLEEYIDLYITGY